MRRVIKECQNNGKALEVRLEEESTDKYYIVIAGMSIDLSSGSANYNKEDGEEDYMFIENDTYIVHPFSNYHSASQAYEGFKKKYID